MQRFVNTDKVWPVGWLELAAVVDDGEKGARAIARHDGVELLFVQACRKEEKEDEMRLGLDYYRRYQLPGTGIHIIQTRERLCVRVRVYIYIYVCVCVCVGLDPGKKSHPVRGVGQQCTYDRHAPTHTHTHTHAHAHAHTHNHAR